MPPEIIRIWEEAAQKILADPEYRVSYTRDNLEPNYIPHDRYGPFVEKFAADTTAFFKATGVIR
jgi:tripartite-type tricarboxylate transporter receptor subunit TctC